MCVERALRSFTHRDVMRALDTSGAERFTPAAIFEQAEIYQRFDSLLDS